MDLGTCDLDVDVQEQIAFHKFINIYQKCYQKPIINVLERNILWKQKLFYLILFLSILSICFQTEFF